LVALWVLALPTPAMAQSGTDQGEWRYWGGDERSSRYSPLDQINAENFADLEVVWRWKSANYGPTPDNIYRATPLYVKGKLYAVAGQRRAVVAIDPATGETLWMYRMKPNPRWELSPRKNYGKGVAYANVDGRDYIYVITPGFYLVALDPDSGLPIPHFGVNGVVDLHLGLGDYPVHPDLGTWESGDITSSAPPIVVNGVIVVNNSHKQGYYPEKKENIPGHIRGYDAKTGKMLWIFHVVPQPGEFGHETWEGDSWTYTGNISTWVPLAADSELGLVFCPTDTPTNDYYGGDRLGDNLYGTSMIALDVKTGKRVWHFQQVHHDVWNYDNPIAPKLLDVTVDGKRIPIVVQATKQGWVYTWNRETGEPVWPIEERPVAASDVPGERLSPTQPFVTKPAPFELQGITEDDLIDFTPELRKEALEIARQYRMGPLFNPPSLADGPDGTNGAFFVPGAMGGANIPGGASVDPETGMLYIATYRGYGVLAMVPGKDRRGGPSNSQYVSLGGRGVRVRGMPLVKPPWGSIVAIDMNTGEHVWKIPNGDTPDSVKNLEALKDVDLPVTGKQSHATIVVTKTLLISGEGRSGAPLLHAVDKQTGKEIAALELPARTQTAPMTYMHEGRQYLCMAIAGPGFAGELIALALPE
jgi:quinoprotein glucose dehydrogenase